MYSILEPERPIPVHGSSQRPLKVLVFPLTWVLAHVGRTIEIGKVLRARGHEVVFAGEDPTHPSSRLGHAAAQGFRTVHVQEPAWHYAWKRFHDKGALCGVYDFFTHQKWAPLETILGFVAVILATLNVVGGFVVTDRMLEMFKAKPKAKPVSEESQS